MSKNPHIGSSLDDFLKEEGIYEDATNYAVKRMLAWQVEKAMQEQGITKAEMARRMGTSRAHLDKLLDPENDKVQLDTVQRAATVVGRRVRLVLVKAPSPSVKLKAQSVKLGVGRKGAPETKSLSHG
jgi:antitoxin HicB